MDPTCFFIDIDGVLYDGENPIRGGPGAIDFLRRNGNLFLLVTNTTRMSIDAVKARLDRFGYSIERELIYTAPMATLEYLNTGTGGSRLFMIADASLDAEFEAAGHYVTRREEPVDAVIIGTTLWPSFRDVDIARRLIEDGAEPIAINRDLFFPDGGVQRIGDGAVVAAMESVIRRPMTVIGKPNPILFRLALAHAGFSRDATVMIGDTPETDIAGARAAGLRSLLVRSGNHAAGEDTGGADWVLDSIEELPAWYSKEVDKKSATPSTDQAAEAPERAPPCANCRASVAESLPRALTHWWPGCTAAAASSSAPLSWQRGSTRDSDQQYTQPPYRRLSVLSAAS